MKEVIVFYIFNQWHYYNVTDEKEGVISMRDIIRKFNEDDRLFSSQVSEFIKQYESITTKKLPTVIDIESYSKQFIQKSKPLESQDKWNLYKLLKEQGLLPERYKIDTENILDYIKKIAEYIQRITENSSILEEERFNSIEIPVNRIIYERQRKGIAIDVEAAKEKIQTLEENVFNIKNELQQNYKIFSPGNMRIQENWLVKNGIEIKGSIERTFKNHSRNNQACVLFYELIRNQKNLDSFLDIIAQRGGTTRAFPSFHGFGTITSRITLREPALQNIRRTNRVIIKPDAGYDFIYIDYSQFEAGILAALSRDKKLCKLYESDIYSDMVLKIWNNEGTRDDAKIEFYKFMYGHKSHDSNINRYFSKFKKLQGYKKKIEKEAERDNLIGTFIGNYRHIEDNFSISLSHKIQATASLIFKEALIEVSEDVPEAEFVLPMHDAALYQVNNRYDFEEITNNIKHVFLEVFAEHCPEISPRVNDSEFYSID